MDGSAAARSAFEPLVAPPRSASIKAYSCEEHHLAKGWG